MMEKLIIKSIKKLTNKEINDITSIGLSAYSKDINPSDWKFLWNYLKNCEDHNKYKRLNAMIYDKDILISHAMISELNITYFNDKKLIYGKSNFINIKSAYIEYGFTNPDYQKKGYFKKLIDGIINEIKDNKYNYDLAILDIENENGINFIKLYKNIGFEKWEGYIYKLKESKINIDEKYEYMIYKINEKYKMDIENILLIPAYEL